jgi:hypothetical protein
LPQDTVRGIGGLSGAHLAAWLSDDPSFARSSTDAALKDLVAVI